MTARVSKANKASIAELEECVPETITLRGITYRIRVAKESTLSNGEREAVWQLLSDNMMDMLSKSSLGWDPAEKEKEIFHKQSRFLLATLDDNSEDDSQNKTLAAFSILRFLVEDRQCVAYCYELQVSTPCRRSGLGRALFTMVSDIGSKWAMRKVMLTVLRANRSAVQFYRRIGLSLDEFSPGYVDEVDGEFKMDSDDEKEGFDYWIMSMELHGRPK